SIPSCLSAIETATGEACACAEVLSVALTASTQGSYGSKRSLTASSPPELIVSSSAVKTNRPPAIASSSFDMPTRWRLLVALGQGGRDAHGRRRVRRIAVGADLGRVLLCHRRAADHDDHVVADAGLLECIDVRLEHGHRRGQEGREADDIGRVLLDLLHERL